MADIAFGAMAGGMCGVFLWLVISLLPPLAAGFLIAGILLGAWIGNYLSRRM